MQTLRYKAEIMDGSAVRRALRRIAHEIVEKQKGAKDIRLIGIQRRGVPLAGILADEIEGIEGFRPEIGSLDITFYRDDLSLLAEQPVVHDTDIPFDVQGARVIIVDDVLYSGRTARAALDAICKRGRPDQVQLAVLIDRGHRELPIRADYVGKNVPTSKSELISLRIPPFDEGLDVSLYEIGGREEA